MLAISQKWKYCKVSVFHRFHFIIYLGDLRVLKIGNIQAYGNFQINYFKIMKFIYIDSQMPFFDLLGSTLGG
jgi:ribonucleotide reductase beta subunit family protein with ferritin-like domain